MLDLSSFQARLISFAYSVGPHGPHITRFAMYRTLEGCLAEHDAPDKRAAVISGSMYLANLLGLRKAQKISLAYPEFTLENLALLDDSCDFIVSDQVLEHCKDIHDVCSETMRVLRPGGWFVHTTCFINVVHGAPNNFWRFTPRNLQGVFPFADNVTAGAWGNRTATILMESGYRLLPVPEDPKNPIHQLAIHNEPDWPVSTWVVGQKAAAADPLEPSIRRRRSIATSYEFAPKPAKLGVVACIRNETPHLLEWIAFQRIVGFKQIVIYDNESNDATRDILGPLAELGEISAVYWRPKAGENKQVSAYNDAVMRLRGILEWCAFIDLDEFIVCDDHTNIVDLLPTDQSVGALGIPWRIFGSSGAKFRGTDLTIKRFTKAASKNSDTIKSIVRLSQVSFMNVHVPQLLNSQIVDLQGEEISYSTRGKLDRIVQGPATVHHYFSRSWEEFECKRARSRGAVVAGAADEFRPSDIFFQMDENEATATTALRFVPAVAEEVARLQRLVRS